LWPTGASITLLQGLVALHTEAVQVFASPTEEIDEARDLAGARIATPPIESGSREDSRKILHELGITANDYRHLPMDMSSIPEAVNSGQADAAILTAGIPTLAIEQVRGARLISLPDEAIIALLKRCPQFVAVTIPARTYPNQHETTETVGLRAILACRADLPGEQVRSLLHAAFEDPRVISKLHELGGSSDPEDLSGRRLRVSRHPGAQSYFRDRRLWLWQIRTWIPTLLLVSAVLLFWIGVLRLRRAPFLSLRRNIYQRLIAVFFSIYLLATAIIHFFERQTTQGFETIPRSFWSTAVYVLSGLESREPRTSGGRFGLAMLLVSSMGLLGSITAKFTSLFILNRNHAMPQDLRKHIAICNWNSRGNAIIHELHAAEAEPDTDIVILANGDCDEGTLRRDYQDSGIYDKVFFIHGDPQCHASLRSARVHLAKSTIILSDENSADPDANSALIALAIANTCREQNVAEEDHPHIIAESINHRKVPHLRDAGVDEVVCAEEFGIGILAQCALNRRMSEVYSRLLHFSEETNEVYAIASDRLPEELKGRSFAEVAVVLAQRRVDGEPMIPLGLRKRNGELLLNPPADHEGSTLDAGDTLIVVAWSAPKFA